MKENRYSIKDLENLTNIKAHTIRIWEQRYKLLEPKRTDTNIRYYQDKELKKLLNINLLYTNGYKISKIAKLSESEIISESHKIIGEDQKDVNQTVELMMMAIVDLNGTRVLELLEQSFINREIEQFYDEIIIPLFQKVGQLWQLNSISVGHEHFFSNIFKAFLFTKTNALPIKTRNRKALLFLNKNEEHEMSLLIYNYILKREGWEVIYLGAKVPFEDLEITYKQTKPDIVVTSFITNTTTAEFDSIIKSITSIIPPEKLVISGFMSEIYNDRIPKQARRIVSQENVKRYFV